MQQGNESTAKEMLSFAPPPIFSGSWNHRPSAPSPLTSSPIRASSPLSPVEKNTLPQRQIQSSPIQPPRFKFASRPTRPNPVVRKREDFQESRRKLFLHNVRQKSNDKAWQRRDIEGQFLKNTWLANQGQLSHDAPEFSEADIEDAAVFAEAKKLACNSEEVDMMNPITEEEELEAMIASYEEQRASAGQRPPSPAFSDDEWDNIFDELVQKDTPQHNFQQNTSDEMDLS